jgi:hypothetical protein
MELGLFCLLLAKIPDQELGNKDPLRLHRSDSLLRDGSELAAINRGVAAELGSLANTQGKPEVGPFVAARK